MVVQADERTKEIISRIPLKWNWLFPLSLIFIALLVFSNSFGREFIWDDSSLILQNRFVRDTGDLPQLFTQDLWSFAQDEGEGHDLYRPLISLSYLIDFQLWSSQPPFYHITNLLFHILTSLVLYFILQVIFKEKWLSWLGALLFVLHPIHTESVAWISGRTDVICGFFFFLAFLFYLKHREQERWIYLIGSLITFFFALLSKEMAITLPLVIVLYTLCFDSAPWRGRWREIGQTRPGRAIMDSLPHLAVVILYLSIRLLVLGALFQSEEGATRMLGDFFDLPSLGGALLLSTKVTALYLRLLFLPYPLNANRLASDLEASSGFVDWLAPLTVVAILILCLLALRRAPAYAFAGFFFFISILPVSWLFPVGDMTAERFLYIPSWSVCLVITLFSKWLWQRRQGWSIIFILFICLPWAVLTYNRNADWQDGMTFWSKTVTASPQSTIARNFLGLEFWYRGQFEQAIAEFEQVLRLDEGDKDAYINLGAVYVTQGRYLEAEEAFQKALALAPETPIIHFNLGVIYELLDDPEQAIAAYQNTLALDPYFYSAYYNLGLLYHKLEGWAEAIFYLERFLDIEPDSVEVHNSLGLVYLQMQLFPQAFYEFERALQLNPRSVEALSNLGMLYLNEERFDEAIPPLEAAVQIAPEFVPAHFNLGLAYLESGSNGKALRELAIVAELDSTNEEAKRLIRELGSQ